MQRFLFLKKCKKFLTIGYQWYILYTDEGGMELEIQYEKSAVKYLKALQKPQRNLILNAIEKLTHKPAEGDIKKMSGYKDGRYRLRVGKYRIIYKYLSDNELEILYIMDLGSRGDIYKYSPPKEEKNDKDD